MHPAIISNKKIKFTNIRGGLGGGERNGIAQTSNFSFDFIGKYALEVKSVEVIPACLINVTWFLYILQKINVLQKLKQQHKQPVKQTKPKTNTHKNSCKTVPRILAHHQERLGGSRTLPIKSFLIFNIVLPFKGKNKKFICVFANSMWSFNMWTVKSVKSQL